MPIISKKICKILIAFLLVFFPAVSFSSAAEVTIFGPQKFIRTTGAPDVYTGNFTGLFTDELPSGKLIVLNGNQTGENRIEDAISSAEIYLNGELVFSQSDFNKNVYLLEADVSLVEANSFYIELQSSPGSYLTIRFIQDIPSPSTNITALPHAIKVDEDSLLTWTSSLANDCSIEPEIGGVDCNGSIMVSPDVTTIYTFMAAGPGGTATSSETITHINSLPVAHDQSIDTNEDAPVPITLTAIDIDNDSLLYNIILSPTHGTLSGEAPNLTYTPETNYNGADSSSFIVNDGLADSNTAMVQINMIPINDSPIADAGADQAVFKGDIVYLDGSQSSDIDGDPLSYIWTLISMPSLSTASLIDPASSNPSFLADKSGSYEITLSVNDGTAESLPDTVIITAGPRMIDVPDVVGMSESDAESALIEAGLVVGSVTDTYDETVPEDNIISQNPASGTVLEEGSSVDLTVSLGPAPVTGQGEISGNVLDAITGSPLPDAMLSLYMEMDTGSDRLISQYTTQQDGAYIFSNLAAGDYVIYAEPDGYIQTENRITLDSDDSAAQEDIIMSAIMDPGEVRIVLTWGASPSDLESHLTAPNTEGCRYHCFYDTREIPGANLDLDDMDSYGPETITMTSSYPGTYRYYVHDFTNRDSTTSKALSLSGAHVRIFFGSGAEPIDYYVPALAGTVWHVFDMDGVSQQITDVNIMGFQAQPGEIDFPVITSFPDTTANLGELYAYDVRAKDPDNDTLTYSLEDYPDGMTIDPLTGTITWTPGGTQGGLHNVAVKVADGWCGEDIQSFKINVTYMPIIRYFSVEPCSGFNPGGNITFTWSTERAETVSINQDIGVVDSSGSLTIPSPAEPVVYTLTAENGSGQKRAKAPQAPSGTLEVTPSVLPATGGTATLSWDFPCAVNCTIDQGIGEVPESGSYEVNVNSVPITYTIIATNAGGADRDTAEIKTECSDPIIVKIETTPVCSWSPGDPITISWTNSSGCVDHCEIDQGIGEVSSNGSLVVTPDQPTIYTLTYSGPTGTGYISVTVPSILPTLIKTFYASPSTILSGQSVYLNWTTQCAETCSIDQGIGTVAANGSILVTPSSLPTTYTLTITGKGETITRSIMVNPRVTATFSATPSTNLKMGEAATLAWTTVNADYCEITPDIGEVALNGSLEVSPSKNTTYRLFAKGLGGYINKYVTVQYIPPTAQLQADKEIISRGESVTLSWVFSNAETCTIDQDIGEVEAGESLIVMPENTTKYTMTAEGPGGKAHDSVTITVLQPPAISTVQPDGVFDTANKYYSIKWTDEDADSNASISLYFDTDNTGADGILIASDILEDIDPTGNDYDKYIWNTSEMAEGIYYVYAVIVDGYHDPVIDYSDGPVTIDHSISSAFKIKADDGQNYDYFGNSVAMDQGYAIVGAYQGPYGSGAAYIFKQEDESWVQQAKLTADDANDDAVFGCSVSISGDYAVVGAYGDDELGTDAGAVYIFRRDKDIWFKQAKLTARRGNDDDLFGESVSICGDLLIVGASGDDENGSITISGEVIYDLTAGAAYIFKRNGSNWILQQKLVGSGGVETIDFGCSVEIRGDRAVIGADYDDAAYIVEYNGSDWVEKAMLSSSYGDGTFGSVVSIDGDYSIATAQDYDNTSSGFTNSGAAYIFSSIDSTWSLTNTLEPVDIETGDYFGSSGTINGNHVIIGSAGDDDGATGAGAAYLFEGEYDEYGNITSWITKMKVIASDPEAYDSFGSSVCLNDGYAIIGSIEDDDNGSESGSAYIYPMYLAVRGSAAPDIIEKGGSTILSWNSVLADSCSISPDIGTVSPYGSIVVSPSETTTYLITAENADGSVSENVTVTVVDPSILPSVDVSASPTTIGYSDSTTLTWNSVNATYCTIEPDIGTVPVSGSITVSPTEHTTYTVTAVNSGGETAASVIVFVICYDPVVTVHIQPDSIELGDSVVITWSSTYADYCEIQPDVGLVEANGSVTVSPEDTTTYILTATGHCGTSTCDIPITVNGPASIEITYPNSVNQYADQTCEIRWKDTGPNIDATISLYYDTDNRGEDGTLIVSGLNETPDGDSGDSYKWDTGSMPEGTYYIYAVLEEGINSSLIDYSEGPINIIHATPEKLKVSGNNYSNLGYSVAISGDYAVASDSVYPAYIFKQDGAVWVEQAPLVPGDLEEYVYNDNSVSIDGDYAIVGVYDGVNSSGMYSGIAYIFERQGGNWIEQAKLEAGDGEDNDYFGCSVSINGDYIIVGVERAENYDTGRTSGAAYIFKREGSSWFEQAKLLADDGARYDYFGCSVSVNGDYGFVGAYTDDNSDNNTWDSGSVYVFKREGEAWIQQAKLTASDEVNYANFGNSVSMDGDCAIIGAWVDYNSGYYTGAAYIFRVIDGVWTEEAKLIAPDPGAGKSFGCSVAIKDSLAIVGADYSNGSGTEAAYIFQYGGANWNQKKKLVREETWNSLGTSVAIGEDFALVGAHGDNDTGNYSGALYFYPLVSVNISAEPETIQSGEESTLTWSSIFADSCVIEPDIGTVAANGSITVTPSETTTYTITATGQGMTITDQVTITVEQVYPIPTVSIAADPATINFTESSVLSWSATDATSCVMDNGIGDVDVIGSITITPSETTTYTITVAGPGGNATASITVTVTYPVPTVTLSAEPHIIDSGGSSVLSWSSQYATSCKIVPDIGPIDVNGDITVYPTETTTYRITATGPGGSVSAEKTVTVNPSNVIINFPLSGSTVYTPNVLVEGTILDQTGEFGVTVNGVVALVDGDYFVANHVPLEEGENNLTIIVTDADGNTTTSTIAVYYEPADIYITLSVDEESGIAPFETTLKIDGTFIFQSEPVITYTGLADIEITDIENDNEYLITIITPGLYFLTVEVEDEGVIYTDTIAVLVMDQELLDVLLKTKWNGMKNALGNGDIDGALEYFPEGRSRERYNEIYNYIETNVPGGISTEAQNLPEPILIELNGKYATYILARDESGTMFEYTLYFIKDSNGLWSILEY